MAFDVSNLTPHDAAAKGAKIWSYISSADTVATILGDGYFDTHAQAFVTGDVIIVAGSDRTIAAKVTAASGDVALSAIDLGGFYTGSTTKAGGTLPVPITNAAVTMTTGGAEALTLADGVPGQELMVTLGTDGGDGTLTPSTATGWATIVFADAGDTAYLKYIDDTVGWVIVGLAGVAAPPVITV